MDILDDMGVSKLSIIIFFFFFKVNYSFKHYIRKKLARMQENTVESIQYKSATKKGSR